LQEFAGVSANYCRACLTGVVFNAGNLFGGVIRIKALLPPGVETMEPDTHTDHRDRVFLLESNGRARHNPGWLAN
jgi:hypothetical protein